MAEIVNKYPVGIQTFEEIRTKNYLSESAETIWKISFCLYASGLFRGKKGTFRRISHC